MLMVMKEDPTFLQNPKSFIVGYYANIIHSFVLFTGFVRFCGISTVVGYVMTNPFYTYISNMISKHIL